MKKIYLLLIVFFIGINLLACESINSSDDSIKTSNEKENVLTIQTASISRYLEVAIQNFKKINPDIKIDVQELGGGKENKEKRYEEYRYNMSANLMSGNAADIIDLEGLAYKKYIDKKMLVDFNKLIKEDKDFDKIKYYDNVFKALEYKDGLYALPLEYKPIFLSGDIDLNITNATYNWENFFDSAQNALANKPNEKDYILFETDEELFNIIFQGEYKDIVDEEGKTANFTSQKFIDMLNFCKNLADHNLICKSTQIPNGVDYSSFSIYPSNTIKDMVGDDISYFYNLPHYDKNITPVYFNRVYGINSSSPNKEVAWEFIKFLLSDEMQSIPELRGFPLNKVSFKERLERESKEFLMENKDIDKNKVNSIFDEYATLIEETTSQVNTIFDINPEITKIVNEESKLFFSGYKSAEQTAKIIQNKVHTYLSEQS